MFAAVAATSFNPKKRIGRGVGSVCLPNEARILIDTQKMNSGGKVYRARVAGLSKTDAQAACQKLKAKSTDCLVLKIDPALAMGN